ncbi:hypothetical protein [Frigidibacter sp. ROC022]|uniref:hypothetical protein n=1 Tax=Frigidibacter sp. ROC022 TaxID=2971796 RepID=UPI00215ADE05|nr:hypothetical protein [Frigidibacter sp. ROC022]MCR8723203.1 hypothetical protein [Frigidibacter sp. ROC022]
MGVLRSLVRGAVSGTILLALLGAGLLWGYPALRRLRDNPGYAEKLFAGVLEHDRVLASRRWHGWGAESWDCSYGIVELSDAAAPTPPTAVSGDGWQFAYGGNWQASPAPPLNDTTRDALDFCSRYWDAALAGRLERALNTPGSWYIRDGVGETVFLYSVPERLAARIRYGD